MCNLYRMTRGIDEIARLFAVEPDSGANFAEEVYPGYRGLVVAQGRARAMTWGFPLVLKGRQGQSLKPRPVTSSREDKLLTPFWRTSFAARRCLVPVSAWAEPVGEKGHMTRCWYSLPGDQPFAVAGLWRPTAEWGDAYSLVLVDGSSEMLGAHDRMPAIVRREDWEGWSSGSPGEALALCRTWDDGLEVDRTDERWAGGNAASRQPPLL